MTKYQKLFIYLRAWLHGRNYMVAAEALDFAARHHQGVRKDGETPEFFHQLSIVHYLRTLEPSLIYPEETLTTGIVHDIVEDYSVTINDIAARFGDQVADSTWRVTKKKDGVVRSKEEYFHTMIDDPIASIVKGADRIHNFQSMVGVFTLTKQDEYIEEAEKYILPMLKQARRRHPRQEPAYENVKLLLTSQIQLIRHVHAALRPVVYPT